jgi:hypothetical protein
MAVWPEALRLFWRSELYSLGMGLVLANAAVGATLSVVYVWWMARQPAAQQDARC